MLVFVIQVLLFFLSLYIEAKDFQTSFLPAKKLLGDTPIEKRLDLIVVKTLPFTGTNVTIAILNQLTKRNAIWSLKCDWKRGVIFNRACVDTDENLTPILASHIGWGFTRLRGSILISTIRDYRE